VSGWSLIVKLGRTCMWVRYTLGRIIFRFYDQSLAANLYKCSVTQKQVNRLKSFFRWIEEGMQGSHVVTVFESIFAQRFVFKCDDDVWTRIEKLKVWNLVNFMTLMEDGVIDRTDPEDL
jgi:hypothetical protein